MLIPAFVFALQIETLGPVPMPGMSAHFQEMCLAVQEKLQAGQFEAAANALQVLPSRKVIVEWDDSKVPAARRKEFAEARDQILEAFRQDPLNLDIKIGKPGHIKFDFVDSLPKSRGDSVSPGSVQFFSTSRSEPRVESVIALRRGNPEAQTEAEDVYNEVGFAMLALYGGTPNPLGSLSKRSDQPARSRNIFRTDEKVFVRNALRMVDALADAVSKRQKLTPARPSLAMDVTLLSSKPVVQGEVVEFSYQVTNTGNALLIMQNRPDCGCLYVDPDVRIAPGKTALVKAFVNTTEFVGDLRKNILVTTNDPEHSRTAIKVHVLAKPLYRLLLPKGPNLVGDAKGFVTDVFLALDPSVDMKVLNATTNGLPATVRWERWQGVLADPELGEPAKPRSGYRFRISVEKGIPSGRFPLTLNVSTDHKIFSDLRQTVYIQTGIIALPNQVYLGQIERAPRRASFFVARPGKPFAIKNVVTDLKFAKVSFMPTGSAKDEYRVFVELDGSQPDGELSGSVKVFTDDPAQPMIEVAIRGTVR